jgi:glycosyltransferase involved in cell wall biosynthesis
MRIALIAPPWLPVPPPAYGGTEAVVDRLARGFKDAEHEVLLFTTGDSSCPVPKKWVYAQSQAPLIGIATVELRHLVLGYEAVQGYDIVHDHTLIGPLFSPRHPDLAVVTTNHGPFNEELRDFYGAIADRVPIIAISNSHAAGAGDIPIAGVIHHGIDVEAFPLGEGDGGYFLFLGRMAPDKGPRRAAEVAREAGVRLIMAAKMREPWEHRYFEEQVQPLLTDDITYIGEIGGEAKMKLLARSKALINPIRWPEPFGLVMVESLACGSPVLAFREGAAPEIVDHGETGFLCKDEEDMVQAIARIDEIDRKTCRDAVVERFSTERMIADHVRLYEKVLAERS